MQNTSSSNEKITRLFLLTGRVEGYSYLALLGIAMPLKYVFDQPEWVKAVGLLHGVLFVAFIGLLFLMLVKTKISFKNASLSFLLSLIPFGTFYLKRLVCQR